MKTRPPNPPAFPRPSSVSTDLIPAQSGMSIRTWLAGRAMQGLLESAGRMIDPDVIASHAVQYADALIEKLSSGE